MQRAIMHYAYIGQALVTIRYRYRFSPVQGAAACWRMRTVISRWMMYIASKHPLPTGGCRGRPVCLGAYCDACNTGTSIPYRRARIAYHRAASRCEQFGKIPKIGFVNYFSSRSDLPCTRSHREGCRLLPPQFMCICWAHGGYNNMLDPHFSVQVPTIIYCSVAYMTDYLFLHSMVECTI